MNIYENLNLISREIENLLFTKVDKTRPTNSIMKYNLIFYMQHEKLLSHSPISCMIVDHKSEKLGTSLN